MSIAAQEEKLFAEWKISRHGFVADGVVDEAAYLDSRLKILLVLKEVNDPRGGGWDLRKFVRDGARSRTWNNVTRWIEGIRRLPDDLPWSELADVSEEKRKLRLRDIAAVNLKKSPGGHTTDGSELRRVAQEDRDILKQQFALYKPDIIICCGTASEFQHIVPPCKGGAWDITSRGVEFYQYELGKYVVKYMHPETRGTHSVIYYGLIDAVREMLGSRVIERQLVTS